MTPIEKDPTMTLTQLFARIRPLLPTLLRRIPRPVRTVLYVLLAGYALVVLVGPSLGLPISPLAWRLFGTVAGLLGVVAAGNVSPTMQVLEDVVGAAVAAAPAVTAPSPTPPVAPVAAPVKKPAPAPHPKKTPTPPAKKPAPVKPPAKKTTAAKPTPDPKPPVKKAAPAPVKKTTPAKPGHLQQGVDVAGYQDAAYATAGLAFVFVKATEGTDYVNPKYAAQLDTGRKARLVVGHYHFLHHDNVAAQVAWFKAKSDVKAGEIIALDWEESGTTQVDRDGWIKGIRAVFPHNRVVLYCNINFWTHLDTESNAADGLWIADPSAPAGQPRVKHPWTFHQYSEVGGIDHDVANFASKAALVAWAKGA